MDSTPPSGGFTADPRIDAAIAGDRAAAQSLLEEQLPKIRNLVRYLVSNDSDVDDMAQQAMIAVLRGLKTFRAEGSFDAWVRRIAAREAIGYAKKARRELARRREAAPDLRLVGEATKPDEYLARRQAMGLLDGLPEEQRMVLVLHHVAGMSVPEVAKELGLPFDTAKSRLRMGMQKLRERHAKRGHA